MCRRTKGRCFAAVTANAYHITTFLWFIIYTNTKICNVRLYDKVKNAVIRGRFGLNEDVVDKDREGRVEMVWAHGTYQ